MKKQDLMLGYVLVAICGVFYFMTSKLPKEATTYPMFVTSLLLFLTIIHLFITYRNNSGEESATFKGLELKQILFVLGSSGLYVAMISILGYISSTIIYISATLIGLKVNRKKSIIISTSSAALIYILFKILLRVPLPTGFLI